MKALFVNGSPRRNKNTAQMLESAMKGAQEAGEEVEMIHLYGLNYQGCKSCFACKIKGSRKCSVRTRRTNSTTTAAMRPR